MAAGARAEADVPEVRPEIAASWHRAHLAGVSRTGAFERLEPGDVDRGSSLLVGAGPVLDELEAGLAGTGYSTILGDRECRIVRRWFDDPGTREGFDALNLREGASLLEDVIGTNGLGTVLETRAPVAISGREHFLESLRGFSCYGHPIRHPLTRRIEGVLDISAVVETASPLLPPLIARAVHDIEQRLLGGSRISERHLLEAFQTASGHCRHAVLAIGEDIVMCNQAASDLLSPADVALLRVLAEEPPPGTGESSLRLTLETGRPADVTVTRVPGARRGVLLKVVERPTGPHLTPTSVPTSLPARTAAPTLVSGPPGAGRTTRARQLAVLPVTVLRAATALLEGEAAWARELQAAMGRSGGSVVVDGIDLLPDELLDVVLEHVDRRVRPQLVLTSGPVTGLTGRAATLAGTATVREVLTPLAARRADIPELVTAMLAELGAAGSVHLTPGALHALAAVGEWPGNLRELKAVVAHTVAVRPSGGVTVADLPEQYRVASPVRPLAALDRAEHDAIVTALRAADGNKVQAARELGVSRTTLYARIRQLHITGF